VSAIATFKNNNAIEKEVKEKILYHNPKRLYGL
jgi:predicted TIM-barrel fold metal-dependent hydrolase